MPNQKNEDRNTQQGNNPGSQGQGGQGSQSGRSGDMKL